MTQYVRQEKAIAAADKGGIRERWMWGLRLLRDPEAITESKKSLQHGVTDELIEAAKSAGFKLTDREIRYRLQCARTYRTESEIGTVCSDFETWSELRAAGFPTYDAPPDEPPADHRTDAERKRDKARALLDQIGEQGTLFPLDEFEPSETTLKQMLERTEDMAAMTARFAARDVERRAYVDALIAAADGDLSMTWRDAQDRLNARDSSAPDETEAGESE